MEPHELAGLLSRIHSACDERPVPRLAPAPENDLDRLWSVETLSCLWSDDQIPDIPCDAFRIESALIWLSHDEFRFAFLRLMAVGVGRSNEAAIDAVLVFAAEPVPKDSCNPPRKFAAFSPTDIQLVSDVICRFVSDADMDELFESGRRIYLRSQRNWKLFAEASQ